MSRAVAVAYKGSTESRFWALTVNLVVFSPGIPTPVIRGAPVLAGTCSADQYDGDDVINLEEPNYTGGVPADFLMSHGDKYSLIARKYS